MNPRLALALILALTLAIIPSYAGEKQDEDGEWYPFVIPAKLDPDSPANIGKLVLDPPAGKHGFCKVKDGHFYFEDGTRARFWGTNLCFQACFPTHEQAVLLADRIAFFGFNAVRLHHMDSYFEPRGIFEDVDPAYTDPQMKRTGTLSKRQLDRLDYLIYQLKLRGIYIDMNLLVSRHFTLADGVTDADQLEMAAKPVSMFDPTLIKLQKKYAKDLLTHRNPYTGLRYCDDPAVALVEITNENSIISAWKNDRLNPEQYAKTEKVIPPSYSTRLDRLWNDWLKEKYGSPEAVKQAWQATPKPALGPETIVLPPLTDWQTEQHQNARMTINATAEQATFTIEQTTDTSWHLQFKTIVPVENGTTYALRFTAYANTTTPIGIACQQNKEPWSNLGLSDREKLTPTPRPFQLYFTASHDYDQARISFSIGYVLAEIVLKDIRLEAIPPTSVTPEEQRSGVFTRPLFRNIKIYTRSRQEDILSFYAELEKAYIDDMLQTLRAEIEVKVPITGIGGFSEEESEQTQADADFLDKHAYWDHPQFPNKKWDRNDFRIHNKSLLKDSNRGFINSLVTAGRDAAKLSKPFTVTEWNHCYPNDYAYETPVLLATKARENDWDALFQFAFSHEWQTVSVIDSINSYFDISANGQQLILCSMGSVAYLMGETESLKTEKETLAAWSLHEQVRVRNFGAGWNESGVFNWGTAPTQVRNITPSEQPASDL